MRVFVWTIAAALLLFGAPVDGECPNGCSGNGDCMAKDMCNCYKNYQGNDCADRTCLFGYAHVDTPKGDINMDQSRKTSGWILTSSQQHPEGTYEYRNPDAVANEAHFYMECSNKGICDRATGICNCFDGYDGNGCQRTSCPNRCSGHGTCESLRELGSKAGGTLFGKGTAAGSVKYDLWDANSTYGCHCDPWFQGPDCNKRTCKVGVDPLYLSAGTPRYETFVVHAYTTTGSMTTGSLRLRVFDYYGESYLTEPITILDDVTAGNGDKNAAAVAAAIKAIPNQTFRDIKCEDEQSTAVGASFATYKSLRVGTAGLSVICQFVDNPGVMRIPEVASYLFDGVATADQNAYVATTALQGENDDWFTTKTSFAVTTTADSGVSYSVSADPTSLALTNKFIKLGPHIVHVASFTASALTFTYPIPYTLSTADKTIFTLDSAVAMSFTVTAALNADFNVGDKVANFGGTASGLAEGDLVFFENQFFNVRRVWLDTNNYVEFDKPFGGQASDGDKAAATATMLKVVLPADKTKAYNYVSECSGRGLCGTETGICTCFKGYTNDNCNTQNILAL